MVEYTHFHIIQLWTAKTSPAQSDEFDEFFFTDNQIKAKKFKLKRGPYVNLNCKHIWFTFIADQQKWLTNNWNINAFFESEHMIIWQSYYVAQEQRKEWTHLHIWH